MEGFFRHKGHLLRVAALFVGGVVVFAVLQALLVPAGFGAYGHYRAGALEDNRARPLVHAGRAACVECHVDPGELLQKGRHAGVRCEACHGPLARHAEDPSVTPVRPDPKTLCVRCHQQSVARPARFPQVDAESHSGGESCATCHRPHDPLEQAAAPAAAAGDAAQKGASR